MPDSDEPYGVTYPTDLLSSLPILDSDSTKQHPHPIRALPASTFSNLHLTHLLTHPPDHVLFPFIHGLEGTNVAQNQFFATNSNQQQQHFANPSPLHPHHASALPSLPPKYRGLVWVVCDEDLDQTDMSITSRGHVSPSTPSTESDSDSDEEDDDDDDIDMDTDMCYSDTNDNDDPMMQIDSGSVRIQTAGDGPEEGGIHVEDRPAKGLGADGEEKHMHPVQHRSTAIPIHDMPSPSTQTFEDSSASESFPFVHETNLTIQQQEQSRAYRSKSPSPSPDPSPAAASTSLTTASPQTSSTSLPGTSPTTTPTTTPTAGSSPAVASSSSSQPQLQTIPNRPVHRDPPLLTSTFRPTDLIRRVQSSTPAVSFFLGTGPAIPRSADIKEKEVGEENDDDDDQYEFVPLKVPDGISLRNFGIQVPIFATISDIIVYSPKGPTENAIRLARRFRGAIERKRRERAARSGLNDKEGEEKESGLLWYNVFVLDAGEEEMRDKLEYLMIRTGKGIDGMETDVEDESDTDKAIANEDPDATKDMDVDRLPRRHSGSHTDGTDGHTNQEVFGGTQPIPLQSERKEKQKRRQRPNTVNFAEREKEEMRDLTKASEIISVFPSPAPPHGSPLHHRANSDTIPPNPAVGLDLSTTRTHWDPMLGQVFLGNSDDVPLGSDFEGEKERERERARQRQQTKNHSPTTSSTLTNLISTDKLSATDPFNYSSNDPTLGYGYDICLECHDMAPFPGPAHLKAAEEHLAMLDALWAERCQEDAGGQQQQQRELPPRPPPNANAVIHLPFPSSPPCNLATMTALMPVIKFLEKWLQPPVVSPSPPAPTPPASSSTSPSTDTGAGAGSDTNNSNANTATTSQSSARRWSSVTSLIPSFAPFPQLAGGSSSLTRNRAFTSPNPNPTNPPTPPSPPTRTRPLKILIYSSDGYTESSVPALCLLMAVKTLTLPEAYLELQVVKKRSFFVYMSDLGVLRRVEGRLVLEREQERDRKGGGVGGGAVGGGSGGGVKRGAVGGHGGRRPSFSGSGLGLGSGIGVGMGIGVNQNPYTVNQIVTSTPSPPTPPLPTHHPITDSPGPRHSHSSHSLVGAGGRPSAKSVSFAQPPPTVSSPPPVPSALPAMMVPAQQQRRPRASTSPWLPSFSLFGHHQSWFNDPRFDGSFPSRVLPFLYLGNLNHASNAYMLHALGITHVVSVGECALVPPPPPHGSTSSTSSSNAGFMSSSPASCHRPSSGAHFVPGKGPDGQGSLWIEEREGRIKVLDIKGVCDDGIDTLEPQLEPICEWIDKARAEGGQVLVHCRVGVSRSATVVIAYVMKHLSIPLVDAYLIVRSRRLSVLIQPNMRLLYNLCGWEVKLAKDRAGGDEDRLKDELSRTLSWPYLAKEVHTLNEKYLHN